MDVKVPTNVYCIVLFHRKRSYNMFAISSDENRKILVNLDIHVRLITEIHHFQIESVPVHRRLNRSMLAVHIQLSDIDRDWPSVLLKSLYYIETRSSTFFDKI